MSFTPNAMTAGDTAGERSTSRAVDDEAERRGELTEALFSGTVANGRSQSVGDRRPVGASLPGSLRRRRQRAPRNWASMRCRASATKLRSRDIYSAWRLLPELQIGIVHLSSDAARASLIATLEFTISYGIGVSPRSDVLSDIGTALR